jgi:hypothetical protein
LTHLDFSEKNLNIQNVHTMLIMTENRNIYVSIKLFMQVAGIAGVGESARMLNVSFRRLPTKSGDRPPHQHRNGNHITFYSEESASIASFSSLSSSLSSSAWGDDGGSTGGHASTLDRLYAWEKKLYLEVKVTLFELLLSFNTNVASPHLHACSR